MYAGLSSWSYGYDTATYLLLWQRKQRSKSVRINKETPVTTLPRSFIDGILMTM